MNGRSLPTRSPSTSSRRSTISRRRAPRRSRPRSVRAFGIDRRDRAAPRVAVLFQQLFGRRAAARCDIAEGLEMVRLVAAFAVEAVAALEARMRERQAFLGEIENAAPAD